LTPVSSGLVSPGLNQFNVVIPPDAADGDLPLAAPIVGQTTAVGAP